MSRNIATALDPAPATQPTSEDCDAAIAALDGLLDLEATVTIAPEENKRLLAEAFAADDAASRPSTDDEITIDARSPFVAVVARITQRPPALKTLVITSPPPARPAGPPPAAVAPPISGLRPRITPQLAKAARDLRDAEDAQRPQARSSAAPLRTIPETDPQLIVVAGIWAMALSLIAMLAFMMSA